MTLSQSLQWEMLRRFCGARFSLKTLGKPLPPRRAEWILGVGRAPISGNLPPFSLLILLRPEIPALKGASLQGGYGGSGHPPKALPGQIINCLVGGLFVPLFLALLVQ